MKILLQTEARTISDREVAENQAYLINLFAQLCNTTKNFRPRLTNNSQENATHKPRTN